MSANRSLARPALAALIALASFAATPLPALGQAPPARDAAAAEALYKTGRDLVAKGDWAAGCAKFAASMELDPAASTQINIAKCHEHDGKLALAWAAYKRAIVLNQDTPGAERQKTLADLANKGIEALEPRLPKLRIEVTAPPKGLKITRDGQDLPVATLGEALPTDPGAHEITVSAPGFTTQRQTVQAEEGKVSSVTITLVADPTAAAIAGPAAPIAQPASSAPSTTDPRPIAPPSQPSPDAGASGASKGVPVWAWVAGGVGVALVGAGVALRIDGTAAEKSLDDHCGTERRCDPATGYDPADDNARKNRDFGLFVGLSIAGGAAITAGVIGAIVGSGKSTTTKAPATTGLALHPWVSAGSGGAVVRGEF